MEMEYFVPPAEADEWYRYWVDERLAWHVRYGVRESHLRVRPHEADELSHYSSATSDIEYLYPDRLVGARGNREPRRLRPDPAHRGVGDEARVGRRRAPASASCRT